MAKLKVGDPAPDFELPGTEGKTYRLSDYRGKKLILAFYPRDFTAVCTKQFCSYRDEGVWPLPGGGRPTRPARRRGARDLLAVGGLARAIRRGEEPQRAAAGRR